MPNQLSFGETVQPSQPDPLLGCSGEDVARETVSDEVGGRDQRHMPEWPGPALIRA